MSAVVFGRPVPRSHFVVGDWVRLVRPTHGSGILWLREMTRDLGRWGVITEIAQEKPMVYHVAFEGRMGWFLPPSSLTRDPTVPVESSEEAHEL